MKYKVVQGSVKLDRGKYAVAGTKSAIFDSEDHTKVSDKVVKTLKNVVTFVDESGRKKGRK